MPSERHQSRLKAGHEGMVLTSGRAECRAREMRGDPEHDIWGPRSDGIWGVRVYILPVTAIDIGCRYMLNLTNATDRSGFVIKLGFSRWPF